MRARALGYRADLPALVEWANHELDGYPDDAALPRYRIEVPLRATGADLSGGTGILLDKSRLLGADSDLFSQLLWADVRQPVATLQVLRDGGAGHIDWPQSYVSRANAILGRGPFSFLEVRSKMDQGILSGVLSGVRSQLQQLALELERENPDLGLPGETAPEEVRERVQSFLFTAGPAVHMRLEDVDLDPEDVERFAEAALSLMTNSGLVDGEAEELLREAEEGDEDPRGRLKRILSALGSATASGAASGIAGGMF